MFGVLRDLIVRITAPPLIKAARSGEYSRVAELIKCGHEVNIRDLYGRTPLMEACRMGHYDVVKVLLQKGANPLLRSYSGKNSYQYAREIRIWDLLENFAKETRHG